MGAKKNGNGAAENKGGFDIKNTLSGLKSTVSKKVADFSGNQLALVEPTSYEFSPSFIYHNGKAATIVQLYIRRGSNRNMSFIDVLDMLPTSPRDGVKIYLIEQDGVIIDDEKKQLVKKNSADSRQVIANEQNDEKDAKRKTQSEREMDESEIEDFFDYERVIDSPNPVVYYRFELLIIGDSAEIVEEQVNDMNLAFDQRHPGLRWDSLAGDQKDRFVRLFSELDKGNITELNSSTGDMYAGINMAASPGLCDSRGVVIGDDVLSLVGSSAVYDFDGSTNRQALIAIPKSERISIYEAPQQLAVPSASVVAQACANDAIMRGHKAAHIVLNGFNYVDDPVGRFYRPDSDVAMHRYDVSRVSINPMQGFGDIEDVIAIYDRLVNKIVNIFDLLNDLQFSRSGNEGVINRGYVTKAVSAFYMNHALWTKDADKYPKRTRIVNIENPETYPTMGLLVQELTTISEGLRTMRDNVQANVVEALNEQLKTSMRSAMAVVGRTTAITPTDALNTYYDFSRIGNVKMRQIQFINILEYVLYTLESGDMLVIHGADNLYRDVLNRMASQPLKAAMDRGIRVVFAFDTVTSPDVEPDYDGMNMSDLWSMKGPYYTDFGADMDWSMIGSMLDEELVDYAKIMNNAELSDAICQNASTRGVCQVLLHRNTGNVNNFIRLMPVI